MGLIKKRKEKVQTPCGGVVFTALPKSPNQWTDQTELLDNNFRNMMKRDAALYGEEHVKRVYPRASFCIPLLVDPENAYDIAANA